MASIAIKEKVNFGGWKNCLKFSNAEIELIVTTDIGPRILFFGYKNSENLLYVNPDQAGMQGGNEWRIYGGHRLWLSPETFPETFVPDNNPVHYSIDKNRITLTQPEDTLTGVSKEIGITLFPDKNELLLSHKLIKVTGKDIEVAPWAITAFAPNGCVILPQEPYIDENDFYLPARLVALWHYTRMDDTRWKWGNKFIIAKQDPHISHPQKIGLLNKQGWAAYYLNGQLVIKILETVTTQSYPDFGCNNEVYFNDKLIELETLGPLVNLSKGLTIEHTERWLLNQVNLQSLTEDEIENKISDFL